MWLEPSSTLEAAEDFHFRSPAYYVGTRYVYVMKSL